MCHDVTKHDNVMRTNQVLADTVDGQNPAQVVCLRVVHHSPAHLLQSYTG